MAEFPALPLWTDAYLGDTTELSGLQHGAYLLLLITAWRSKDCALPDDDVRLAKIARVTLGQWARLRPVMERFWKIGNGVWMNDRLSDERAAVSLRVKKASDAGRASALKRKHRGATDVQLGSNSSSTITATPMAIPKVVVPPDTKWTTMVSTALGFDVTAQSPDRVIAFLRSGQALIAEGVDIELDLVPILTERRKSGRMPTEIRSLAYFRESALESRGARLLAAQSAQERSSLPFEDADERGWRSRVKIWLNCGYWPTPWGPRPRSGDCRAPGAMLAEALDQWTAQGGHPEGAFPRDPNGRWEEWGKLRDIRASLETDYGDGPLPGASTVVAFPRRAV